MFSRVTEVLPCYRKVSMPAAGWREGAAEPSTTMQRENCISIVPKIDDSIPKLWLREINYSRESASGNQIDSRDVVRVQWRRNL